MQGRGGGGKEGGRAQRGRRKGAGGEGAREEGSGGDGGLGGKGGRGGDGEREGGKREGYGKVPGGYTGGFWVRGWRMCPLDGGKSFRRGHVTPSQKGAYANPVQILYKSCSQEWMP